MKTFLSLCIVFISSQVWAKPIIYKVSDLIGSAKFVDEVVISSYDTIKSIVRFQSITHKDTLQEASCLIMNGGKNNDFESDYWTFNTPLIGDTVLIIVTGSGTASIFGKKVGEYYRLWSTVFSGSVSIFDFSPPVLPLIKEAILLSNGTSMSSWDGCLIPTAQLFQLVKDYREEYRKKLEKIDLSKFENTEVYYIFYDETLKYISEVTWSDEPPGKLRSMILSYSNGESLEVTPHTEGNQPAQFDTKREFNIEEFKKMKIKKIEWVH